MLWPIGQACGIFCLWPNAHFDPKRYPKDQSGATTPPHPSLRDECKRGVAI